MPVMSTDLSEATYVDCRNRMQQILETGQLLGLDPDEATFDFVQAMVKSGWEPETAYRCRNSAASMAHKMSGDGRYFRSSQRTFTVNAAKSSRTSKSASVQALASSQLNDLFGDD